MADYSESLIKSLITKVKEYPRFSIEEIEKFCWMAVHEHKHGVLPSEYDIREIDEDLYLQLLQELKSNTQIKIFDYGEIETVSGNRLKQTILLKQGIKQEIAKKIGKNIRDQIKKINVSINGETLRVSSKSKNDLQLAIKLVSEMEESLNIPLKANNFR